MASKADIKAGGAFVELFVKSTKFEAGLNKAAKQLQSFGAGITSFGTKIAAAGGAGLAAFGVALNKFASSGDELAKMAGRTGMTVEALSGLKYAAEQSGASIDDVEKASKKLAKVLHDAATGSTEASETLTELGLSISDLQGLSPDEQFMKAAMALASVEDASTRAALAQELFGKSGTTLLPLLAEGEAGIAALRAEAERLGITMSSEDAEAAVEFGDSIDRVTTALSAAANAIGAALAPQLTQLANRIAFATGSIVEWIKNNEQMVTFVAKATAVVTGLGVAIAVIGGIVTAVGAAFAGLSTLIGAAVSALTFLVSPIGLAIAAATILSTTVMALGASFIYASGLVPQVVAAFGPLLGAIKTFSEALFSGDFSKAWDIGIASGKYFGSVVLDVFDQLPVFAGYAAGRIASAFVDAFDKTWSYILSSAEQVFSGLLDRASEFAPILLKAMMSGSITEAAASLVLSMRNVAADVSNTASGFKSGLVGGPAPTLKPSERTKALGTALKDLTAPKPTPIPPFQSSAGGPLTGPADPFASEAPASGPLTGALGTALGGGDITEPIETLNDLVEPTQIEQYQAALDKLSQALFTDGPDGLAKFDKGVRDLRESMGLVSPIEKYHSELAELKQLFDAGIIDEEQFKSMQMDALPNKVKAIIERTKSPLEKFNEQISEARDFFNAGLITQEQFEAEQERLQKELRGESPESQKKAGGRVSVSFSAAGLMAQGRGGSGRDNIPGKLDQQLVEQTKQTKLLEAINAGMAAGVLAFG